MYTPHPIQDAKANGYQGCDNHGTIAKFWNNVQVFWPVHTYLMMFTLRVGAELVRRVGGSAGASRYHPPTPATPSSAVSALQRFRGRRAAAKDVQC